MIEVIIASGLFLGFVTTVFYIYTTGTKSINSGSWKLSEQKAAQQFLAEWVKDIERSTPYVFRIASSGALATEAITPIFINSDYYSTGAPRKRPVNSATWKCLMAFSVTKPYQEANATFSLPLQRGTWTGISIFGRNRQVEYIRKGSIAQWEATPISWAGILSPRPVPLGGVAAGADFEPSTDRIQERIVTSSIEELSINATGTPVSLIEIRAKFVRYEGGQPAKPPASFEEVVSVKVSSGTTVQTFVH